MIRLQTLGLAAALGFAGAVLAQTPSPSTTATPEDPATTSTTQEGDTLGEGSTTTAPQGETGTPPISDSDTTGTAQEQQTYPSSSDEDAGDMSGEGVAMDTEEDDATRVAAADDMKGKHDKHRVSKLIGKNVETSAGDTIGEVKDVVIDDQAKVTHFIVSHGRLGSTKLAAVPYDTVKQSMREGKIVFEKTRLENAPSFKESNFPNLASATWSADADRYWGRSRTAALDTEADASMSTDAESTGTAGADADAEASMEPAAGTEAGAETEAAGSTTTRVPADSPSGAGAGDELEGEDEEDMASDSESQTEAPESEETETVPPTA